MNEITNKPTVKLTDRDGNAFAIIGACQRAARTAGLTPDQIKPVIDDMMSGDYDHLLQVAMRHFDVV